MEVQADGDGPNDTCCVFLPRGVPCHVSCSLALTPWLQWTALNRPRVVWRDEGEREAFCALIPSASTSLSLGSTPPWLLRLSFISGRGGTAVSLLPGQFNSDNTLASKALLKYSLPKADVVKPEQNEPVCFNTACLS